MSRAQVESWICERRKALYIAWGAVGSMVVIGLLLGPDEYVLRGTAPLPQRWVILFFLSLWCWAALRFIALWIWPWVVMAVAPVCLFIPLRYHLDAWWLTPLLTSIVVISALTVVAVVWWELRRRRAVSSP